MGESPKSFENGFPQPTDFIHTCAKVYEGKVVEGGGSKVPDSKIDCAGLLIAPGLIDLQVCDMMASLTSRLVFGCLKLLSSHLHLSYMPKKDSFCCFQPKLRLMHFLICIDFQINGAFGEDFTSGAYYLIMLFHRNHITWQISYLSVFSEDWGILKVLSN